jgi:hypothetical protein
MCVRDAKYAWMSVCMCTCLMYTYSHAPSLRPSCKYTHKTQTTREVVPGHSQAQALWQQENSCVRGHVKSAGIRKARELWPAWGLLSQRAGRRPPLWRWRLSPLICQSQSRLVTIGHVSHGWSQSFTWSYKTNSRVCSLSHSLHALFFHIDNQVSRSCAAETCVTVNRLTLTCKAVAKSLYTRLAVDAKGHLACLCTFRCVKIWDVWDKMLLLPVRAHAGSCDFM